MKKEKYPACNAKECAACDEGRCNALTKNNFGTRKCPFFKTKEQAEKEKDLCEKRMAEFRIGGKV